LINIGSGSVDTPSPYYSWHNKAFDFKLNPVLPFGSVIAAHRPLADQTTLSGRSIEAIFIGIAHSHANAVVLFNPASKRSFVRHSFKYLSDELPPTSYTDVYFTHNPSSTLLNPVFEETPLPDDKSSSFSYVPLSISKAPAATKFAFAHINNSFLEKDANTTYIIKDIVNLSSPGIPITPCLKFYDTSLFKSHKRMMIRMNMNRFLNFFPILII